MDEVNQATQLAGQAVATSTGLSWVKGLPVFGKLIGIFGAGGAIAAYLVMSATKTGDDREFRRCLASTFITAVFGGAAAIRYLGISNWAAPTGDPIADTIGIMGLCGVVILCGVPGWLFMRSYFNFANANKDSQLPDLWKKLMETFKK